MSYFPVVNLSRRICRHACETRARLVLARLSASPRSIAVYVAAVELGLPKGAVGRSAGRSLDDFGRQFMLRPGMPEVEQRVVVRGARVSASQSALRLSGTRLESARP